jgi:putative oxidoreductase
MTSKILDWMLRLGLGALFIVAGVLKLRDPGFFAVEIANYRFMTSLAPYLAVTLPAIEVALGIALVASTRKWRQAAALGMIGLMVVFTVAVSQVVARHIAVECGCFDRSSELVTGMTIVRDVGLLAAAAVAYVLQRERAAIAR